VYLTAAISIPVS